jgi:hypothetical protein
MDLVQQLSTAAAESGIAELAINSGEACSVTLDSGPEITFELADNGEKLFLYAPVIGHLPDDRTEIYEAVLSLNLFGRETAGGTIGYDESRDELLLIMSREEHDGIIDFEKLTGTFVAVLEHCAKAAAGIGNEKNIPVTAPAMMNMRV